MYPHWTVPTRGPIPSIFRLWPEFWIAGMLLKEKPWGPLSKPMTCYPSPQQECKDHILTWHNMQPQKPHGTKRTPKPLVSSKVQHHLPYGKTWLTTVKWACCGQSSRIILESGGSHNLPPIGQHGENSVHQFNGSTTTDPRIPGKLYTANFPKISQLLCFVPVYPICMNQPPSDTLTMFQVLKIKKFRT